MSSFKTIQSAVESGVQIITLNRPEALNAFNDDMSVELAAALRLAQRDEAVRCLVLTGAGRAFCSGQDLQSIKRFYEADAAERLDFAAHLRSKYNPLIERLRGLEKPVLAAVNGVAAGAGASLALAADIRVCARSASFVMAFVHVGLVPDSGATQTLVESIGYARAAELCFLGEKLPAEEAQRCGLVNRVVEDAELMTTVNALAQRLATLPTAAIGLTKRALQRARTVSLESQLEYEALLQATAGETSDHREGVRAFLEKRRPQYVGK